MRVGVGLPSFPAKCLLLRLRRQKSRIKIMMMINDTPVRDTAMIIARCVAVSEGGPFNKLEDAFGKVIGIVVECPEISVAIDNIPDGKLLKVRDSPRVPEERCDSDIELDERMELALDELCVVDCCAPGAFVGELEVAGAVLIFEILKERFLIENETCLLVAAKSSPLSIA